MKRTVQFLLAPVLALQSIAIAQNAQRIDELVSEDTFAVLQIRNLADAIEQYEQSPLKELMDESAMRTLFDAMSKETVQELNERLEAIGVHREDLAYPTGLVAVAFTFVDSDDEFFPREPAALLVADFAEGPEGERGEELSDMLLDLLERAEEDEVLTLEIFEHEGTEIYEVLSEPGEVDYEAFDEDGMIHHDRDQEFFEGENSGSSVLPPRMYISWHADTLLLGSHDGPIRFALDALAGAAGPTLAEGDEFSIALGHHPDDALVTAAVMVDPLLKEIERMTLADAGENAPDFWGMMDTLGLTDVSTASASLALSTPDALSEITFAIDASAIRGLLSLISVAEEPIDPPAFVGPDVAAYSTMQMDFPAILPLVDQLMNSLNDEQRQISLGYFQMARPLAEQVFASLGHNIHIINAYNRPFAHDSEQGLIILEVTDELVISNAITQVSSMASAEARQFEGNTIWSSEAMGAEFSVGLGFGYLFTGTTTQVESAMRLAANPEGPKLATEPGFESATRFLSEGYSHQYQDAGQFIEFQLWQIRNAPEIQAHAVAAWLDLSEEEIQEWIDEGRAEQPDWIRLLPPPETFTEYIGDIVTELTPADYGLKGRTLILRP